MNNKIRGKTVYLCYYCGNEVTKETHGWNAIEDNERWLCHSRCMKNEEVAIFNTNDWERGEKFGLRHILTNPLARGEYTCTCGCIIGLLKNEKEEPYHFSGMDKYCWKHWLSIRYFYGLDLILPRFNRARKAMYKRFYRFIFENLKGVPDVIIDDYMKQRLKEFGIE